MKNIEIQTDFDCLIVTDKENSFATPADILELTCPTFAVYPTNVKKILPFKVDISIPLNKNYRIVESEDKFYCFLFSSSTLSRKGIEKIKVGKNELEITISQTELEIKSNKERLYLMLDDIAKTYSLSSFQNFLLVHLHLVSEEQLVLFNISTSAVEVYKGKHFKVDDKTITFTEYKKDFARSESEKKLTLNGDEIKEEEISLSKENYILKEETICYAFLDCIKNGNFSLAKELLSSHLQSSSEEKFKDFFGTFYKFFPISFSKFVLIYPTETKTISFSLENKKIVDFEMD